MTVHRCATSANLLPASTIRSAWLSLAVCAAMWAALNLFTRCSGVSPGNRDVPGAEAPALGGRPAGPPPPALPPMALAPRMGEDFDEAGLDVAWGMVDVNRVASLADRAEGGLLGPLEDIVVMLCPASFDFIASSLIGMKGLTMVSIVIVMVKEGCVLGEHGALREL